jgi:hypothetical protein
MALDYDTDLKVSLETETELQSLYKWCLKEQKEDGTQVGPDLIPFKWSIFFHSTSFGIQRLISSDSSFRLSEEDQLEPLKFSRQDAIFAKLETGAYEQDGWRPPSFSMIGTRRLTQDINLRIQRIDDVESETCRVWGTIAYESEFDFRDEREEDTILITLYLADAKFDSLFDLISRNSVDRLSLRLNDVQGFYSEWSPSISTHFIKVLADLKDQGLEVDEDWGNRIPTLGKVGEASLTVQRTIAARIPERSEDDYAQEWQDDDVQTSPTSLTKQFVRSKLEPRNKFYERALSRISKLLGVLIIVEVVRLFSG